MAIPPWIPSQKEFEYNGNGLNTPTGTATVTNLGVKNGYPNSNRLTPSFFH
jgi:hypothetical protein